MDWIQLLNTDEDKALKLIYRNYRTTCIHYLLKKYKVNKDQAVEIFQASVVILYENCISGKLKELNSNIQNYLIAICCNKIREYYRKIQQKQKINAEKILHQHHNSDLEEVFTKENQFKQLEYGFSLLEEGHRKILEYYYLKRLSMKKITELLKYKNESTTKSMKYKAIKKLKNIISNMPPDRMKDALHQSIH